MESGPFRAPQSGGRVPSRQEPAPRKQEEIQPVIQEPRVAYRAEQPPTKKRPMKRIILPIIAIIVALIAGAAGGSVWSAQNSGVSVDSGKYQAVFFTNGQVYFGKLRAHNSEYMKLTDIFYLQAQASADGTESKNPQQTSADDQNNVQLIKLGNEVHGPEDEMVISKDQVLFYENLKADGKVAQSIEKYKKP